MVKNPEFSNLKPYSWEPTNPNQRGVQLLSGKEWNLWNNGPIPSITTVGVLPSQGDRQGGILHVCTHQSGCGPYQTFDEVVHPSFLRYVQASVWVKLIRGNMSLAIGDSSDGLGYIKLANPEDREWQEVTVTAMGREPVAMITLYSASPGGACYYIDNPKCVKKYFVPPFKLPNDAPFLDLNLTTDNVYVVGLVDDGPGYIIVIVDGQIEIRPVEPRFKLLAEAHSKLRQADAAAEALKVVEEQMALAVRRLGFGQQG